MDTIQLFDIDKKLITTVDVPVTEYDITETILTYKKRHFVYWDAETTDEGDVYAFYEAPVLEVG